MRERKKLRARDEILKAARELVHRKGFEATTMHEIAAAAEISYQTLYNYFPSKAHVLGALLTESSKLIGARLGNLLATPAPDLTQQLCRAVRYLFDGVHRGNRALWCEVAAQSFRHSPELLDVTTRHYAAAQLRLGRLFEEAKRTRILKDDVDTALLAETLYAIVDFAFLRFLVERGLAKAALLRRLNQQVELLLGPHLRRTASRS